MQDCVLPALLWQEFEYKKMCPQGYSTLWATLTNNFVIGQTQTVSHKGDTENNNTLHSEMLLFFFQNTKTQIWHLYWGWKSYFLDSCAPDYN